MSPNPTATREGRIPIGEAGLFYRDVGTGPPILVLHGGPDFDFNYLLPDLDRLADSFRLLYYDQRGRGRSAEGVRPSDVSLRSEVDDVEAVRAYFGLDSVALLGHSFGALLAAEYAIRHPARVSHLILASPAPLSRSDYLFLREEFGRRRPGADAARMKELAASDAYAKGDPETTAEYNRIHFTMGLRRAADLDRLMKSLTAGFTSEGILKARAIEDRLREETWLLDDYDLLPALRRLAIPALVIHGDHDLIPLACAAHAAEAIPGARLVVLEDCGHFGYLEMPDAFGRGVRALFGR
ncbi:MAG: alpha/beta fold hydrolase [Candidatus Eiseniibacteriota bacterium]